MSKVEEGGDYRQIPQEYEVLDSTALAKRLGVKRQTVLAYLTRKNYRSIPKPDRRLAIGPLWYEGSVRQWESQRRRKGGQES